MYCGWSVNKTIFRDTTGVLPQVDGSNVPLDPGGCAQDLPTVLPQTLEHHLHGVLARTQVHSEYTYPHQLADHLYPAFRCSQKTDMGGWERNPEPQQDAHLRCLSCSILRLVIGRHWEWHYSTVFQSSCHFSHNVSALITQLSFESCSSRVKNALELKAQASISEDESLNTSISRHMLLCRVACGSLFTIVMTLI